MKQLNLSFYGYHVQYTGPMSNMVKISRKVRGIHLATELTEVFAVLTDFHLLDLLPQTSPITGT